MFVGAESSVNKSQYCSGIEFVSGQGIQDCPILDSRGSCLLESRVWRFPKKPNHQEESSANLGEA